MKTQDCGQSQCCNNGMVAPECALLTVKFLWFWAIPHSDYSNLDDLTTSLSTFVGAITLRLRRNDLLPVNGKILTTPFNSSKRHRFPVRQNDFSFASLTVCYISSTGGSKPPWSVILDTDLPLHNSISMAIWWRLRVIYRQPFPMYNC